MKRLIGYIATIVIALAPCAATAQEWTVGPVTPNWSSTVTWTPPADPDDPVPADAYEPPISEHDDVLFDPADWVITENNRTQIGTSPEAKFRTTCSPSFTKRADPILFRGQYPAGHQHTFFGPIDPYIIENVHNFDYDMGRAYPASACQGGPLNATLYWETSAQKVVNTLLLEVMPEHAAFYYTHIAADGPDSVHLRRNINFIGGANPMDYNDTAKRKEYADADLEYPGSPISPAGFGGIECKPGDTGNGSAPTVAVLPDHALLSSTGSPSATHARYLVGPNGEDPWDGACTAGSILTVVRAQDCWDQTNLHSPNGRDHWRYSTRDEDNDPGPGQCPLNYAKTMHFEAKVTYLHNGWDDDLRYWFKSSDRMRMATTECPDATAPCDGVSGGNVPATINGVYYSRVSLDACRATGLDFCSFATNHFDWWGAWRDATMRQWERNCGGLSIDGVATAHADCNVSGLDTNVTMRYGGAPLVSGLSTNPIESPPADRASASAEGQRYFPIRPSDQSQGALTTPQHDHP